VTVEDVRKGLVEVAPQGRREAALHEGCQEVGQARVTVRIGRGKKNVDKYHVAVPSDAATNPCTPASRVACSPNLSVGPNIAEMLYGVARSNLCSCVVGAEALTRGASALAGGVAEPAVAATGGGEPGVLGGVVVEERPACASDGGITLERSIDCGREVKAGQWHASGKPQRGSITQETIAPSHCFSQTAHWAVWYLASWAHPLPTSRRPGVPKSLDGWASEKVL